MNTLDDLAETFELLGDWEERYRYLIELGRKLEPLKPDEHSEANKVRGCMSQVWLVHEWREGRLWLRGDSDAHIVKGLVAVLLAAYSGQTAAQILATEPTAVFTRLGLESHITQNRRNGFFSMVERIRALATQPPQ